RSASEGEGILLPIRDRHSARFPATVDGDRPVRCRRAHVVRAGPAYRVTREAMIQSLYWHERRSPLVLDQEHHQEFGWLRTAGVPVDDVDIVRPLMESLSGCQCELFSTLPLHHNGALEYVDNRNGEGYHVQSGV